MIMVPENHITTMMSLAKEREEVNQSMIQEEKVYERNSTNQSKHQESQWNLSRLTMKDVVQLQEGNTNIGTSNFRRLIQEELFHISSHVNAKEQEQLRQAKNLLLDTIAYLERDTRPSISDSNTTSKLVPETNTVQSLRQQAQDLVQESLNLRRWESENYDKLKSIVENADKHIGCAGQLLLEIGNQYEQNPTNRSAILAHISDIFSMLELAATSKSDLQDSLQAQWVAPSSFERKTIKFWVQETNLDEVMLVLSTLSPLLVYGRSGRLSDDLNTAESSDKKTVGVWETWSSLISSVYFDSPQFKFYSSRLAREQGSRLLRARWYGKRPEGSELIHLELKTHNEKWVNEKSTKQRVSIQAHRITDFLAKATWTIDDAKQIVTEALPNYNAQKTEDAANILLMMHEMVVQLDLRPCLRTVYRRVAFQSSRSNALRFTVDKKVTLIKEQGCNNQDEFSWCYPDNFAIPSTDIDCIPFSVIEVKLAGSDMPSAIDDLEQKKRIICAEKFSKFLTGTATFYFEKVKKLPYWADHPEFARLFQSRSLDGSSSSHESFTSVTSNSTSSSKENLNPFGTLKRGPKTLCNVPNTRVSSTALAVSCMQATRSVDNAPQTKRKSIFSRTVRPEKSHLIASRARVRVEPKSFFANERTLIQWMTGALLLMTVSALLLDVDDSPVTYKIGFTLVLCSAFIVCYGVFVYFRRIHLMTSGSPYGYVDYVGPLLLASCILGSVVIVLYFLLHEAGKFDKPPPPISSSIHNVSGVCEQYTFQHLSKLDFQPSDVAVDSRRNILLVPSLSQIVSVPMDKHHLSRPRILIDIPGADFEALTMDRYRVFAVSEGKGESNLFVLGWNTGKLHIRQQFLIATEFVEGIAFVPDTEEENSAGKLFVAGNNREGTRGFVDVYDIPTEPISSNNTTNDELVELTGRPLNANVLAQGLSDSKIASMTYFEKVLYILHDNSEVVRAWNVQTGDMLAEWKLPYVDGGFSKQWEGMALERRADCSQMDPSVFLRGSGSTAACPSSLLLHLTLDSPGQIWTVVVQMNATTTGSIILPSCAAASKFNTTVPPSSSGALTMVPV